MSLGGMLCMIEHVHEVTSEEDEKAMEGTVDLPECENDDTDHHSDHYRRYFGSGDER